MGALEGPIGALAGFLPNMGQLYIDLRDCETQYGCPGQQCSTAVGGNTGVCCGYCDGYDPNAHVCENNCAEDESCRPDLGQCRKNCKGCGDYLVDGRQEPCGRITNNCDQELTCNGCPSNQRCENRRCVPKCPPGARRSARAGEDECCLPQTCAELGVVCGSADDGCGGTIQCECPNGLVCTSGICQCQPRTCADVGVACGSLQDGCGQTVQCGNCPVDKICTADGQCVGPCEQPGHTCRWVGTVTQHHAFHGETPFDGGASTKNETRDASYTYKADGTITVVSSEQGHVHTDDPTICNHLIEDTRWQVSGHTEEIEGSISCGRPGSDVCEFSVPNIYRPYQIQVCTTMDSGANSNCGEPGCIEQTRNGVASINPFSLGAPTTTTLSGSWADTQNACGGGYCGPNTIERSWSLIYTQVD